MTHQLINVFKTCQWIANLILGWKNYSTKLQGQRQGVDIFIGKTTDCLCPVAALLSYIAVKGYGKGLLSIFSDGRFLTRDRFIAEVREAMCLAGLNYNDYSGHSFRIGATTTAAQKGISDSTIKMLARTVE